MLTASFAFATLAMLLGPLVVAMAWHRRTSAAWRFFGVGALTFALSQVVHVPLNWGVGQAVRASGWLPPESIRGVLLALALGLSAGLCEELARYIVLKRLLRPEGRTRVLKRGAIMLGLGHGGIEAIITGALVGLGFVNMLVLRDMEPPDDAQLRQAVEAYWATPWPMALVGAAERVSAMTCHVALQLMVFFSVTRARRAWLIAAIAGHTALDAGVVWIAQHGTILHTEIYAAALALGLLLWTVVAYRRAVDPVIDASEHADDTPVAPMKIGRASLGRVADDEVGR